MATMAYAATSMAVLGFRLRTTTAKNCGRSALPYLPLRPSTPFLSTNIKHSTGEDAHWFSSFQIRASEQTSDSVEDIEVFSDIKEKESFKYPVKRTLLKVSADRQCRTYFALGFLLNSIISPSANATILKQPVDVSDIAPNMQNHIAHTAHDYIQLLAFADLDPATAKLAIGILGPLFSAFSFLFIVRIVMSWYPKLPVGKFPYVLAYAPTEPILIPTRKLIPPLGGVDVTPVVWFGLISFLNEILVGPQGLLILLSQQVQ